MSFLEPRLDSAAPVGSLETHPEMTSRFFCSGQVLLGGQASALFRRAGIAAPIVIGSWSPSHKSAAGTLTQMQVADVGGMHAWVQVGSLGLDPSALTGPSYGWEQIDGGGVSQATAFSWTYHPLVTAPDNGVFNYATLNKYAPQ